MCRFLLRYTVTYDTYIHIRDTYSCCRHYALHREIYRSIKVEHFDNKSAAIRGGGERMPRHFCGDFNADTLKFLHRDPHLHFIGIYV